MLNTKPIQATNIKNFFIFLLNVILITNLVVLPSKVSASSLGNILPPFDTGQQWNICQGYNSNITHNGTSATGLDLTDSGCNSGAAGRNVRVPVNGYIYYWQPAYGNLCINLSNGHSITLTHIDATVTSGNITAGQVVGTVAAAYTRNNNGTAHIHFQMWSASGCYNNSVLPFSSANNARICGAPDMPFGGTGSNGEYSGTTFTGDSCSGSLGSSGRRADLAWFQNPTLYTFTGPSLGTSGSSIYSSPAWGGVGDYNHDGKDDLFLYNSSNDTIYWMSSNGTTLGANGIAAIRSGLGGTPDWAGVGDFDGDGFRDEIAWFKGNTLYTLGGSNLSATGTSGFYAPTWGGVGDYDHDGRDDLFLYNSSTTTIYWMSSTGTTVGGNGLGAIRGPGVGAPSWAAVGNFAGTGYRDSLAWFQGNTLFTMKGAGLGTSGSSNFSAPTWGGVADYNEDGKDDLYLYNGSTTTIYWMSSNGTAIGANGLAVIRGPGVGAPNWAGVGNFSY